MPPPSGPIPAPLVQAFQAGLFELPRRPIGASAQGSGPAITSAGQAVWNVPVIMVGFSDHPLTHTAAEFETALFDTTGSTPSGSVYDYYRWASNGRLRVQGKVIATINLPSTRDFYAYSFYGLSRESTPQNLFGLVRDALLTLDTPVDWSQFDLDHDGYVDMLWVIHQGVGGETTIDRTNLWSITSRLSGGWRYGAPFVTSQLLPGSLNQYFQIDRFSTLPELSAIIPTHHAEIGVFCHEFGHALGLPDLYDTSGIPSGLSNVGPGYWSLMSTGAYGGQGLTPERPAGLGGWCNLFLGWGTTTRPSEDGPITLRPIMRGDPLVEFWFQGESNPEHFILENRRREGFDSTLPADGLLVTHVDEAAIAQRLNANRINSGLTPGLQIVEADGRSDLFNGANRGEASDVFPGPLGVTSLGDLTHPDTHTFLGGFTGISLGQIQSQGEDVHFSLQVRAPGWGSELPIAPPLDGSFDTVRPGHWARADAQGNLYCVHSEPVGGVPQIVLITRRASGWLAPEVVSQSPVSALDPAIACLPGGDLAVVWTDLRTGKSQIFIRVRIRGTWQPETPITDLDGDGHHASVGADAHGMVQVAWIQDRQGVSSQIEFKRFAYISPFGTPTPVTFSSELPDPPALEVRPDGSSYLVWSDRSATPRLYFARFHPDSGMSPRAPLTLLPGSAQVGATVACDTSGTLHIAWIGAGSGISELHYQRRRASSAPAPQDTVLDHSGYLLQNASIACDDSGGVHLVYENWSTQASVPEYRLWSPTHGWDWGATDLPQNGAAAIFPAVLPWGPSNVTTLYLREDASELQLVERDRRLGVPTTAATPRTSLVDPPGFAIAPNPLRAGSRLGLAAVGDGNSRFEIFDIAGRRVAEIPGVQSGAHLVAEVGSATTSRWPGGVYFARLSGRPETRRFVVLR